MGEVDTGNVFDDMSGRSKGSTEGDGSSRTEFLCTFQHRLVGLCSFLSDIGVSCYFLNSIGGRVVDDRSGVSWLSG